MTRAGGPIDEATYDGLIAMTGGDLEFINDLVDTYLADGLDQLAALDAAVASNDAAALTRPAHSLKSSSLNLGALLLGEMCRELEEQGRATQIADASSRVAGVRDEFDAVRAWLLEHRATQASA